MDINKKAELLERIQHMNGKERAEYWRMQTLVNRVKNDSDIVREYYELIIFIEREYKNQRFECIQSPLLFLISHCMEVFYKCVIKQGIDHGLIFVNYSDISHNHNLDELKIHILSTFKYIANSKDCPPDDKSHFNTDLPKLHENIVESLKADTTTYRYAYSLQRNGEIKGNGHSFKEDYESPNMKELFKLFSDCYYSLLYTISIIENFKN